MKRGWIMPPPRRGCSHPLAHFKTDAELDALFEYAAAHPQLTMRELGAHFHCSHMCVWRILKHYTYTPRR